MKEPVSHTTQLQYGVSIMTIRFSRLLRYFSLGLVAGLSLLFTSSRIQAQTKQPPLNIIFILADDLGVHDLGCYGSTFYETPNLDRLAAQGVRFTQAYAACPVCSPTRAAFMTGQYPARTGVTDFIGGSRKGKLLPAPYAHQLALDQFTVAEAFREAGYATGMAGKWHLGTKGFPPEKQGFAEALSADPLGWNGKVDRGERVADFAEKFIEKHRAEPFFLYLPHNLVHIPLIATEKGIDKYKQKAAALPARDEATKFRPQGDHKDRRVQDHPVYAAMMEDLDTSVGRVLEKLDALGLTERTLVVFTSDNGGLSTAEGSPTSNAPLRAGKGWLYEGGIREPLIIRWPGVAKAGLISDVPVITTDFYPTLLDAAGIKLRPKQHCDGLSFASVLRGGEAGAEFKTRPLFWHYPHYSNQGGGPAGAVRHGDWKLIETYENGRVELFNLQKDPTESHDVAATEIDRLAVMNQLLANWRTSVGAKMPLPNPDFKPNNPK
ncbi:sulfatase [soil metagenome]